MEKFAWKPPADSLEEFGWEPGPRRMSRESRVAMVATFAMLTAGLIGMGMYTVYHKVLMPTPVALGAGAAPLELPAPRLADSREFFEQVAMTPPEEMVRRPTGGDR